MGYETPLNHLPSEGSFALIEYHASADFFGNIKQAFTELWDDTADYGQGVMTSLITRVYRDGSRDTDGAERRSDDLKLLLQELREDAGLGQVPAPSLYVPLAAAVLLPAPAATTVAVAGVAVGTKAVCVAASALAMFCSHNFWSRFPDLEDRFLQSSGARVAALCGALCAAAALGGDVLPQIFGASGSLMQIHIVKDAVTLPLVIANIGYILGASSAETVLPILIGEAGVGAAACANLIPQVPTYIVLESGAACAFIGACVWHLQSFSQKQTADRIGLQNQRRGFVCLDLFGLSWFFPPILHAMSTLGLLPSASHDQITVVFDLLNKLSICHLALNKRDAVEASANYFAGRPQLVSR